MKGYIDRKGIKHLLKKNQSFIQSLSGKTGYFIEKENGYIKIIHTFRTYKTIIID